MISLGTPTIIPKLLKAGRLGLGIPLRACAHSIRPAAGNQAGRTGPALKFFRPESPTHGGLDVGRFEPFVTLQAAAGSEPEPPGLADRSE
ncbi:MAG TPA: hypothetical protein VKP69_19120, partial [Isosphaeraceae bacterium]|nr:hypothetical protein [Isosphaeraceae bacterium]